MRRSIDHMIVPSIRAAAALFSATTVLPHASVAADTAHGAIIFESKCAACHAGGGNVLNPLKTLDVKALEANKYNDIASMVTLMQKGKGQMPKYQGAIPPVSRLTDEELEDVAKYVLDKANAGW